jgi:RNA polymerase primary sigma factor
VRSIAARYTGYGMPLDDLVQEGAIALLGAMDDYDPSCGCCFESYARFRIRQAIRDSLTDQARLIRLPKHLVDRRRVLDAAEARLLAAGEHPTPARLAAATALSLSAVFEARRAPQARISLDQPVLPDGSPLEELVADAHAPDPSEETTAGEQLATLRAALSELPDRQRQIVSAQWGLDGAAPMKASSLADELKLSPRRTQTLGRDALYKLRRSLEVAK